MSVGDDDSALFLELTGLPDSGSKQKELTHKGAAKCLWNIFVERLC